MTGLAIVSIVTLLYLFAHPAPPSPHGLPHHPTVVVDHLHAALDEVEALRLENARLRGKLEHVGEAHEDLKSEHEDLEEKHEELHGEHKGLEQQLKEVKEVAPPVPVVPAPAAAAAAGVAGAMTRKLVPTPQNGGPACAALDCRPLLTGCGRSGTHYLSDVIIKNNIPILHERIGAAGSVSWIYGAPYDPATDKLETWFSNPDGSDTRLRASADFDFYPLVHVVRHPLKAIASLLACFCGCGSMSCGAWADEPSWEWSGKHLDYSQKHCTNYRREGLCIGYGSNTRQGRLVRAVEYWVGWNEMVEAQAHYRMTMEDYDMDELVDTMGWRQYVQGELVVEEFKRKSATKVQEMVTWEEIRDVVGSEWEEKVWVVAQRYGYTREMPVA